MIDVRAEELIPFEQAPAHYPGYRLHRATATVAFTECVSKRCWWESGVLPRVRPSCTSSTGEPTGMHVDGYGFVSWLRQRRSRMDREGF